MPIGTLQAAVDEDAAAIAAIRLAAARDLTGRFGQGTWSFTLDSEAGVRLEILGSNLYVAREADDVVGTLKLSTRKPWMIDEGFFTACERPWYLTAMAVRPDRQRCGIGRKCIAAACRIAAEKGAGAVRLDSYDAAAGAGEFYRKCGFREVRRNTYHGTPLIWFERML